MLSMTGYGRARRSRDGRDLLIELKAVNHRFLDVSFRIPKMLAFLEEPLRRRINDGEVKRGHIDLTVTYQNMRPDANIIVLDQPLLTLCDQKTREIATALGRVSPTLAELIEMTGALTISQADEDTDAVSFLALAAYDEAAAQLQAMRAREGLSLAEDLASHLTDAETLCTRIAEKALTVPETYRERLDARLKEWSVQVSDPQRIAQEVALMADHCAIDEELSRLKSHFDQFRACLTEQGEVGRRMDFLLQEMNRETNTIGSKASNIDITQDVMEVKCLLEKLREQVQNVV